MYRILFLFFTVMWLAACGNKPQKAATENRESARQLLDNRLDMTGADSMGCYSATVINAGEAYTEENFPAPGIAVLNKTKKYIVVGIGRDRIVLRSSGGDSLHLKGEYGKHLLKAYRNPATMKIDSVVIFGIIGQGRTIMRYRNAREKEQL